MFPHERSLVAKMKDEPFALIGVNSDTNFEKLKQKEYKDEKITWRSFSCGEQGTSGPIPTEWGVRGWPTICLIDAQGNLRKKWVGSPGEEIIDVYGKTVNVAASLPSAGLAMSPAVFRSLEPATRQLFKKHTPPVTYIGVDDARPD